MSLKNGCNAAFDAAEYGLDAGIEFMPWTGIPDAATAFNAEYKDGENPAPRAPPDPQASNAERPRRKARPRRKTTKNSSVLTYSNVFLPYSSLTYQYIRQGPFFFPLAAVPPPLLLVVVP